MGRRRTATVNIAPGQITASRDQVSEHLWGPRIDGGSWIIATAGQYGPRWAIPVIWDESDAEECEDFDVRISRVIWECEHPEIVAALCEADSSTRTRLRPRPRQPVPDAIADALADLNDQARDRLD